MKKQLIVAAILALSSTSIFASISPGIQDHSRGDVIAVKSDSQIAAWCDFSKQIVVTQTSTLCVYNGSKITEINHEMLE